MTMVLTAAYVCVCVCVCVYVCICRWWMTCHSLKSELSDALASLGACNERVQQWTDTDAQQ
jgi:hypothetical protein